MSFGDNVSAIDDSYEPIHFHTGRAFGPGTGDGCATYEYQDYSGPRSGHWTIRDSFVGSGIDNGCPTEHGIPATNYNTPGHVQPLTGDVIQRLAKAAESQKKAEDEGAVFGNVRVGVEDKIVPVQTSERSQSRPQGFFVPKIDGRGIRIRSKEGKNEVVKTPQISLVPMKATERKQIAQESKPKETQPRTSSAPPSVKPEKAVSLASAASQQSKRGVRITSKNGEEVFLYLPIMKPASNHVSHMPSVTEKQKTGEDRPQSVRDDRSEKALRDYRAAKAAHQLREERAVQKQIDEQRAEDAKIAAEMLMSGALPPSSKPSSARKTGSASSAKGSAKDSGVAFRGVRSSASKSNSVPSSRTSGLQSKAASSIKSASRSSKITSAASSKTSVAQSQQATSVKSAVQSSKQASSKQSIASRNSGWREISAGKHDTSESKGSHHSASARSWRSKSGTPEHPLRAAPASEETRSDTATDRSGSTNQMSNHSNHSSAPHETIFAGQGWISPHPLSLPPSEFKTPPDPAIKIPSRNGVQAGATMTYDEWMRIQQSEEVRSEKRTRRNFSRTSSDAGGYRGGSWGFENLKVAESVQRQRSEGGYFSPTVESVRSDGTYEHEFDGVREEDGKIRLWMPWDEQN